MINATQPLPLLGGLSPQQFLSEYWQKKPLLIRQAVPNLTSPVSAEELAGMTLEPDVNARLIQENHPDEPWHVSYSPFDDDIFDSLPESHWTFLLTDCEKHWPELQELVKPFNFIPDWRRDDLMISYAADQGNVGAHIDDYDVFLLQLEGTRHLQINASPVAKDNFIDGLDIRILKSFEPTQEWILEPGDMLYLPPRIAHHGTAKGACMTASIGFRAPAQDDLMQGFLDECLRKLKQSKRYRDPHLAYQPQSAEISPTAMTELWALLAEGLQLHEVERNDWLGRHLTDTHDEENHETLSREAFFTALDADQPFQRSPFSRLNFTRHMQTLTLFANGQSWALHHLMLDDVQKLCAHSTLTKKQLNTHSSSNTRELLYELHLAHALHFL